MIFHLYVMRRIATQFHHLNEAKYLRIIYWNDVESGMLFAIKGPFPFMVPTYSVGMWFSYFKWQMNTTNDTNVQCAWSEYKKIHSRIHCSGIDLFFFSLPLLWCDSQWATKDDLSPEIWCTVRFPYISFFLRIRLLNGFGLSHTYALELSYFSACPIHCLISLWTPFLTLSWNWHTQVPQTRAWQTRERID